MYILHSRGNLILKHHYSILLSIAMFSTILNSFQDVLNGSNYLLTQEAGTITNSQTYIQWKDNSGF